MHNNEKSEPRKNPHAATEGSKHLVSKLFRCQHDSTICTGATHVFADSNHLILSTEPCLEKFGREVRHRTRLRSAGPGSNGFERHVRQTRKVCGSHNMRW